MPVRLGLCLEIFEELDRIIDLKYEQDYRHGYKKKDLGIVTVKHARSLKQKF